MGKNKGLNFGYIGLGQCGGNIANEFSKRGNKAIVINTSQTDLELLDSVDKSNRLLVNNGIQGAGKNPEVGRAVLEEKIDEVYSLINNVFGDIPNQKLFVCAGLGGGTGCGMISLICEILIEQGYNVGAIITLPSGVESARVQLVALSTYQQLMSTDGISSVFVIDNKKATDRTPGIGLSTKYKLLNTSISKQINNINLMASKPSLTAFDAKELDTTLGTRGLALINQITINNVEELKEELALSKLIKEAIGTSLFPEIKEVKATAAVFLFELPKKAIHLINEQSISKMTKEVGNPFDISYGLYEAEGNKGVLTILLTGLNPSLERIDEIEKHITEKEEEYTKMFERKTIKENKGASLLAKFSQKNTTVQKTKEPKKEGMSTLDRLRNKKK